MTKKKRVDEEDKAKMELNFRSSLDSVQVLLNYAFKDMTLLEAALTVPSHLKTPSYQHLEFVGDAALGLALTNFVFISYPNLDPGDLSLLRSANTCNEKLARVAARHGLFRYVRHNSSKLNAYVVKFCEAIKDEGDEIMSYAGTVKAPKVLADIVESIAGALYVDCDYDLKVLWKHFGPLLDPIVTVDNLTRQPVAMLHHVCHKQQKHLKFVHLQDGTKAVANIFVDGDLKGSVTSENREVSKIMAAKEVLQKIHSGLTTMEFKYSERSKGEEISEAEEMLFDPCNEEEVSEVEEMLFDPCNDENELLVE